VRAVGRGAGTARDQLQVALRVRGQGAARGRRLDVTQIGAKLIAIHQQPIEVRPEREAQLAPMAADLDDHRDAGVHLRRCSARVSGARRGGP